jgi:succinate dehydrogenase (ubiquinone) cytochrome b560 subunit
MVLGASRLCLSAAPQRAHTTQRQASTQSTTPDEALEILKKQRAQRPVSPHLDIYQPQLTWLMSGFHRLTGVALTFSLYAFLYAYVLGPAVGLGFDSNTLMQAFGALPLVAKIPIKFFASIPFTYQTLNGVRHLVWDSARELTLKGVYRTGYTVLGLTTISSLILAFI